MKSKIISALALFAIIGAVLWGVNYRLDHPPLSAANKEFRALVAGADIVEASQWSCQTGNCYANVLYKYKPLNAAQTRELIEQLRFVKVASTLGAPISNGNVSLYLKFRRRGKKPLNFTLTQTALSSNLIRLNSAGPVAGYQLNPRFEKPLRRYLDAVLPQRIHP